jgi:hypothetical protein
MRTITLQDLKTKGAKSIPDDRVVYLIVNSKPKSVLVPPDQFEALVEAYEDLEDIKIAHERKDEEAVSYEEVFGSDARESENSPSASHKRRSSSSRKGNQTRIAA